LAKKHPKKDACDHPQEKRNAIYPDV